MPDLPESEVGEIRITRALTARVLLRAVDRLDVRLS